MPSSPARFPALQGACVQSADEPRSSHTSSARDDASPKAALSQARKRTTCTRRRQRESHRIRVSSLAPSMQQLIRGFRSSRSIQSRVAACVYTHCARRPSGRAAPEPLVIWTPVPGQLDPSRNSSLAAVTQADSVFVAYRKPLREDTLPPCRSPSGSTLPVSQEFRDDGRSVAGRACARPWLSPPCVRCFSVS